MLNQVSWQWFYIESKTRKYDKGYGFLSFARKYIKQLLDNGLDAVKTVSEKVIHKAGEFLRNTIANALTATGLEPTTT